MPRSPRIDAPGAIHHVTARGVRRLPLYLSDADYRLFVDILGHVAVRFGWRILAYCVMPNHFHLVIQTPRATLSAGMHCLNSRYAHSFNAWYGHTGHVFEARFASRLVERDGHLAELVRYVHRNPVRAGLCADPGDWRWSSYRALAGKAAQPRWLDVRAVLELFAARRPKAVARLTAFVADAPPSWSRPP